CANAILGQGQLSLAKFLLIVAHEDDPHLDIHDIPAFFTHLLQRVDWTRDLHFQTRTTIDTLDYSGTGLNAGSKVVIAAAGPKRRELATVLPGEMRLPEGFANPRFVLPGIVVVEGTGKVESLCEALSPRERWHGIPLVVLVDDSAF